MNMVNILHPQNKNMIFAIMWHALQMLALVPFSIPRFSYHLFYVSKYLFVLFLNLAES